MAASTEHAPAAPPARAERISGIEQAVGAGRATTEYVPFRDGYIEAPVVAVDEALLVYRADNGRLFAELAARGADRVQREDAGQQALLHELLLAKARDPDGPIFSELEAHRQQTAPLLITPDGIVVNGNRRLASMRELRARDPAGYAGFANIAAAVLPAGLASADLEFVEAALQMAPELKLEYSWINRRLKLRDQRERLGLDDAALVAAYRFADAGRIDAELAELALAEEYLTYLGEQGDYSLVLGDEELFVALAEQHAQIAATRVAPIWKAAGFAMLAARDAIDRPLSHYYPFTPPRPPGVRLWVPRALGEERGLVEAQPRGDHLPLPPDAARQLASLLADRCEAEANARAIVALIDTLRANNGELLGTRHAITYLRRANDSLRAVDPAGLEDRQRIDLVSELKALRDWLERLQGTTGSPDETPIEDARPGLLERLIGRS